MFNKFFPYQKCKITYKGKTSVLRSYRGDYITGRIKLGKFYEMEFLTFLEEIIEPGNTIIDAGSFIGNHTLFFAEHCKAKKVHAFEPFPSTFSLLKDNIGLNGLEDVVSCHNVALGLTQGIAKMSPGKTGNQGTNHLSDSGSLEVEVTSLDTVLAHQISDLALIKVDTEGCGESVLRGAMQLINKFKPIIAVEISPEPLEKFIDLLEPLGYRMTHTFNATPTHVFQAID